MPQAPIPPTPLTLFQLRLKGGLPTATGKVPRSSSLYNEFYCTSGGSNLNSGTDENASAYYTSTNGNWDATNRIFTPTDGSNPATSGIAVGRYVSVYLDAASVGVFVARVTNVVNAVNGAVTVSATNQGGTAPTTGATGRTLKAGGAWRGPSGSSRFPFDYSFANLTDIAGNWPRLNMKNDQTYSITSGLTFTGTNAALQGYSQAVGDGGRATIDGGNSAGVLLTLGSSTQIIADLILANNATGSPNNGLSTSSQSALILRVTVHDVGSNGFNLANSSNTLIECEAYRCNLQNQSGAGGFRANTDCWFLYCTSYNNTGDGMVFVDNTGNIFVQGCIFFNNTRCGAAGLLSSSQPSSFQHCDFYNNGADAIRNTNVANTSSWVIRNCNFVKNGGYAFASPSLTTGKVLGIMQNCGFGNGTQSNGGVLSGTDRMFITGKVDYPVNVTPWLDPTLGKFDIILPQAISAGAGAFTITQSSVGPTVGYPDIGAAQAQGAVQFWAGTDIELPFGYINYAYGLDWTFVFSEAITLQSGSLPPGLSLTQVSATEWTITGTPTTLGTYDFVLRSTVGLATGDATFHITIQPDPDQGSAFAGGF